MPEGDSVVRTARRLDDGLRGQVLTRSDLRVPSLATRDLTGATVLGTATRGKHLLTRLDSGLTLHTHLKMEGHWSVQRPGSRWRRPWHTARVVLATAATEAVGFSVVLDLVRTDAEDRLVGHLGPDLLGDDWDAEVALTNLVADPTRPVVEALLDQRVLAGIGNVFACEICFLARVDPRDPVGAVPDLPGLVAIAHEQLVANRDRPFRVTTGDPRALRATRAPRSDYRSGAGQPGSRQGRRYWVYGHRGPCARCGTRVRQAELGPVGRARPTYWCPACQPRHGAPSEPGHPPGP